jgi:hypothetical protein
MVSRQGQQRLLTGVRVLHKLDAVGDEVKHVAVLVPVVHLQRWAPADLQEYHIRRQQQDQSS